MGTFGDFGDLGLVATSGLARYCGPSPVDGVRAEEVLRVGTWTASAISSGEGILISIWSTIWTDEIRDAKRPTETKRFCLCYHETRPSGQEQRLQWHGQQHCLV